MQLNSDFSFETKVRQNHRKMGTKIQQQNRINEIRASKQTANLANIKMANENVTSSSKKVPKGGTRVCIKNVPVHFNEDKLRKHLQSSSSMKIIVTDCKILRTKEGKSRKLAFVGFKDAEVCNCFVHKLFFI